MRTWPALRGDTIIQLTAADFTDARDQAIRRGVTLLDEASGGQLAAAGIVELHEDGGLIALQESARSGGSTGVFISPEQGRRLEHRRASAARPGVVARRWNRAVSGRRCPL